MSLCLQKCLTAVTLSLHLLFHRLLNFFRRNDVLKFNACNLDAPLVCGIVKDGCHLAVYSVTRGESAVEFKFADNVTQSGCGKIFKCVDGVNHAVCKQFCIKNTEENNGVNLHGNVVLCDNRLRRRVDYLLL